MTLDLSAIEKLAEKFAGTPTQTGAQIGQLTQLALMAALEDQSCRCEPCMRLRQAVKLMKETAPPLDGAPPRPAPPPPGG